MQHITVKCLNGDLLHLRGSFPTEATIQFAVASEYKVSFHAVQLVPLCEQRYMALFKDSQITCRVTQASFPMAYRAIFLESDNLHPVYSLTLHQYDQKIFHCYLFVKGHHIALGSDFDDERVVDHRGYEYYQFYEREETSWVSHVRDSTSLRSRVGHSFDHLLDEIQHRLLMRHLFHVHADVFSPRYPLPSSSS